MNKLSLNLNKTKVILFGNRKIKVQLHLEIDYVKIERVGYVRSNFWVSSYTTNSAGNPT